MRKPPRRPEVEIEREERVIRRTEAMPPYGWKRTRVVEKKITLPRVRIGSDEIAPKDLKRK